MNTNQCAAALRQEIRKVFIGKDHQVDLILMSIFVGGHVLLDDLPGSGKTTLIKTMSKALGCQFRRIQFTPDLLPSDILGMTIYDQNTGAFRTVQGPIFTNILLADEINRAIPRTQSALLEAMEEQQVTLDNESLPLPKPFFVMATQNPVERESTFTLPAAQMDRFFVRLSLGFPTREEEQLMLETLGDTIDFDVVDTVSSPEALMALRQEIQNVHVSDHVSAYIVDLVHRTREHKSLSSGASPRASRCLYQGGKSWAAMQGRDYVTPEDIQAIFLPVLSHRVQLTGEAKYTGKSADAILSDILTETPVPPKKEEMFHEAAGK